MLSPLRAFISLVGLAVSPLYMMDADANGCAAEAEDGGTRKRKADTPPTAPIPVENLRGADGDQDESMALLAELATCESRLARKFIPFSQKVAILKLIQVRDQLASSGSAMSKHQMLRACENEIESQRDKQLSTLINLGILSALIGCSTFQMLMSPLSASVLDPPSGFEDDDDNDDLNLTLQSRYFTIACGLSTAFSFLALFMATWLSLVATILLPTPQDIVWFMINIPAVMLTSVVTILGIIFSVVSAGLALFSLYSSITARITVICGVCVLTIYLVFFLATSIPLFLRINARANHVVKMHGNQKSTAVSFSNPRFRGDLAAQRKDEPGRSFLEDENGGGGSRETQKKSTFDIVDETLVRASVADAF